MKLYYSPGACSLAPHIVLREAGLDFSLVRVDTGKHRTESGDDYFAINPKGQVPLLELDDGSRLSEGPIIAQYIADQAETDTLMPRPGSLSRYRVLEWQNYITSELHKSFTPLFNPELDDKAKQTLSALLYAKLAWLDQHLATHTYLTGAVFTAADAYLFVVCSWSKFVKLDLSALTNVQRFLADVAARPAVREAMKAESLATH